MSDTDKRLQRWVMQRAVSLFFVFFPVCTFAQAVSETRSYTFYSEVYGEDRSFRMEVPVDAPSGTKYNVLFVLDADLYFEVVASQVMQLQAGDVIPPTVVVAMDYGSGESFTKNTGWNPYRFQLSEDGMRAYEYVNEELLLFVDRVLPTAGFRTMAGWSYAANYLAYYIYAGNANINSYLLFAPETYQMMFHSQPKYPIPQGFKAAVNQEDVIVRVFSPAKICYSREFFYPSRSELPYGVNLGVAETDSALRYAYAEELVARLQGAGIEDSRHEIVDADKSGIVSQGIGQTMRSLYDRYWNLDSLDMYNPYSHRRNRASRVDSVEGSVWKFRQEVEAGNLQRYGQPLRLTGRDIREFLRMAYVRGDSLSMHLLLEHYRKALDVLDVSAEVLHSMGFALFRWMDSTYWEEACTYMERSFVSDVERGRLAEAGLHAQYFVENAWLEKLGELERAWEILEWSKETNPPVSRVRTCYLQGMLSAKHQYRMCEGVEALETVLSSPDDCRAWISGDALSMASEAWTYLRRHAACGMGDTAFLGHGTKVRPSPFELPAIPRFGPEGQDGDAAGETLEEGRLRRLHRRLARIRLKEKRILEKIEACHERSMAW